MEDKSFIDICKKQTMIKTRQLLSLENFIEQINKNKLNGAIVECGVWKGGAMMWMIHCQKKYSMDRNIYLYDTFNGMPCPSVKKDCPRAMKIYNQITNNKYSRKYDRWHEENKWAYAPLELVKNNIKLVDYNNEKINYIVGDVCKTLNNSVPDEIAILRLDTDWYESTKKELNVLFPKVVKNGIVIVDDYYTWRGSKDATDEFLEKYNGKIHVFDSKSVGGVFSFIKK